MFDWYLIKRWWRFWFQRRRRGWDDSDTWSLDGVIARFVLLRLRRFRELRGCHPSDMAAEQWNAMLEDIIYAMEVCADDDRNYGCDDGTDWDRVHKGLDAFGSRFRDLWW